MSSSRLPQGADGQHDGVVSSSAGPRPKGRRPTSTPHSKMVPFGLHLLDPAVEQGLVHLEIGDAVADQAAGPVVALVDDDLVPGLGSAAGRPPCPPALSRPPPPACPVVTLGRTGVTQPCSQA